MNTRPANEKRVSRTTRCLGVPETQKLIVRESANLALTPERSIGIARHHPPQYARFENRWAVGWRALASKLELSALTFAVEMSSFERQLTAVWILKLLLKDLDMNGQVDQIVHHLNNCLSYPRRLGPCPRELQRETISAKQLV